MKEPEQKALAFLTHACEASMMFTLPKSLCFEQLYNFSYEHILRREEFK